MAGYLLRGGRVFDGTGEPAYEGDVVVRDGRVEALYSAAERTPTVPADLEVIDVAGQWVMPGFIDNHTHYDGEVLVAPSLSESVRHGVTTVVLGGCSLSFVYADVEDCCDMFTRVEAFPRDILLPAMRGKKVWSSAGEWVAHLESLPLGPHVASFIGHSDLRARAMGLDASLEKGKAASADELRAMTTMLDESLDAGFLGISMQHNPWDKMDGRHWSKLLPAAYASGKERRALTRIVRRRGAHLQGVPNLVNRIGALWYMAQSASFFGLRSPLKASMVAMMDLKGDPYIRGVISALASFFNRLLGADFRMQTFTVPFEVRARGMDLVIFEEFPAGALARHLAKDPAARDATLRDPAYRARFKRHYGAKLTPKVWQRDFGDAYVLEAPDAGLIGKSFTQIAEERGQHPVDTFLDLVLELDEQILWRTVIGNHDPERYGPLYNDLNGVMGFADSGAHINNLAFYNNAVRTLRYVQASHESGAPIMSIERAVWRLTKENADFFNLDAGHLAPGKRADITVIDPSELSDEVHGVHVVPFLEGAERLVNRSGEAVHLVMVEGRIAWRQGRASAALGSQRLGRFLPGKHEGAASETRGSSAPSELGAVA